MSIISTLIPVYKESDLLETLLNQLIKDPYKDKEIITVIDEPTKNSMKTVKKYKNQVRFVLNKERKGKANALNEAAKTAKGDILLFIDSDCIISNKSSSFIGKIASKMKDADLLDIKKGIIKNESFFSKMFNYESLCGALASWVFDKLNICLGLCGQAFAVKRDFFIEIGGFKNVIAEDLELGIQTYLRRKKYRYMNDVELYSKAPSSLSGFLKQRKRWGLGAGYHYKKYWKHMFKVFFTHPKDALVSLYYFWPTMFSLLGVFFINSFLGKFLFLTLISLSFKFTFLMPIILLVSFGTIFVKNLLLFLITYVLSSIAFFVASKKLNYNFNNKEFAIYYLIYSPISFIIYHYYFFRALLTSDKVTLEDWKF